MLNLDHLNFTFAGNKVKAIDSVSLGLARACIHAVIGENGAGKSTIARLCTGHLLPDSGTITWGGRPVWLDSPAQGLTHGLALVPQHPRLAPDLSVGENLILGQFSSACGLRRFGHVSSRHIERQLTSRLATWQIRLPLATKAARLDAAHIHWAAIAEALLTNPDMIFLDEPSAPYSPEEVTRLYTLLRRCADHGMGVVVITHRLQEVLEWADQIHILRHGKLVSSFPKTSKLVLDDLLQPMFGHPGEVAAARPAESAPPPPGTAQACLELVNISVQRGAGRHVRHLDFQAEAGMISGLIGIKDQGLEAIEDLLAGMVPSTNSRLLFDGQNLHHLPRHDIAYIPSRRFQRGIAAGLSIGDNLASRDRRRLFLHNWLNPIRWESWKQASGFDLDRSWDDAIVTLSGGMIQRLVFERELANPVPRLVLCAEPYWGLDRHFQLLLLERLRTLAKSGAVVLILSSDLDEAMESCDRLAVINHGTVVLECLRANFERERLAGAMIQHRMAT